ncbi:hypothetical protein CHU95_09555 [Niveispirillum lacus]|uniref:HTH LytTR-type domain-containing protein n=1 Tax=Niveispirillum lacus TaxID=1981099 RepID=A0A255Z1P2_9PROT|nr:LytTR family DNA-binding domain-containing protein [Niveispirillum lacus]OYQ34825.1 hypothetical protein CHU95_09555 [Niveispirillum lacus]
MKRAPSIAGLLTIWVIVSVALTIMGPFGTMAIPFPERLPYWLGLMAVNGLKWWLWFRFTGPLVRWRDRDMAWLAVLSVFILQLTLPFEVRLANWAVGVSAPPYLPLYGSSVALGLMICAGVEAVRWILRRHPTATAPAAADLAPPVGISDRVPVTTPVERPDIVSGGLLARAGVGDADQVLAVEAEDHYLRLYLADGRKPLVLYRLRDALAELSHLDGEQVHRGYWVAGRAVQGLERRDGRKWALRLESGMLVPVSATFLPAVRRRGWRELAA